MKEKIKARLTDQLAARDYKAAVDTARELQKHDLTPEDCIQISHAYNNYSETRIKSTPVEGIVETGRSYYQGQGGTEVVQHTEYTNVGVKHSNYKVNPLQQSAQFYKEKALNMAVQQFKDNPTQQHAATIRHVILKAPGGWNQTIDLLMDCVKVKPYLELYQVYLEYEFSNVLRIIQNSKKHLDWYKLKNNIEFIAEGYTEEEVKKILEINKGNLDKALTEINTEVHREVTANHSILREKTKWVVDPTEVLNEWNSERHQKELYKRLFAARKTLRNGLIFQAILLVLWYMKPEYTGGIIAIAIIAALATLFLRSVAMDNRKYHTFKIDKLNFKLEFYRYRALKQCTTEGLANAWHSRKTKPQLILDIINYEYRNLMKDHIEHYEKIKQQIHRANNVGKQMVQEFQKEGKIRVVIT